MQLGALPSSKGLSRVTETEGARNGPDDSILEAPAALIGVPSGRSVERLILSPRTRICSMSQFEDISRSCRTDHPSVWAPSTQPSRGKIGLLKRIGEALYGDRWQGNWLEPWAFLIALSGLGCSPSQKFLGLSCAKSFRPSSKPRRKTSPLFLRSWWPGERANPSDKSCARAKGFGARHRLQREPNAVKGRYTSSRRVL
jgi:hypothetical protein